MDARVMDVDGWAVLEQRHGLRALFAGYVGGFEPAMFWQLERKGPLALGLFAALKAARLKPFSPLRAIGGPRVGYALGVYSTPA
jgi:hypothetical protein